MNQQLEMPYSIQVCRHDRFAVLPRRISLSNETNGTLCKTEKQSETSPIISLTAVCTPPANGLKISQDPPHFEISHNLSICVMGMIPAVQSRHSCMISRFIPVWGPTALSHACLTWITINRTVILDMIRHCLFKVRPGDRS